MVEAGYAREPDLQRDRDVPLDLLGAPAVWLGDDLDQGWDRVWISLDVEPAVGSQPATMMTITEETTMNGILSAYATSR